MSQSLLNLAWKLTQSQEPFVLATVVWCERPTSAKPGAQAIIQQDGHITGWIGGSCAQPVVIREALLSLHSADNPYLLRLGTAQPTTDPTHHDVRHYPMTCSSGGALDIYMEPHLPPPQMLLVGDSPIISVLQQLMPILNFSVTSLDEASVPQTPFTERSYVLVASHGQYDEEVLTHILRTNAAYVALIASPRRAETCRTYLRASGLSETQVNRLKAPAGLDIGAVTPEEIATSIMSEIIQITRRPTSSSESSSSAQSKTISIAQPETALSAQSTFSSHEPSIQATLAAKPETAIDPVCKMLVDISTARHTSDYQNQTYYFCCPACKRLFASNPTIYLATLETQPTSDTQSPGRG